ncbi:hypothetical protein SBDP2_280004 [Syntrophobacter sp. SbD2]|nr:hypothetical protein SBDP2_280004 [Syntrophobacter sp. SbD2]
MVEKNVPDIIKAATVRAAMQKAQTLNMVRLWNLNAEFYFKW